MSVPFDGYRRTIHDVAVEGGAIRIEVAGRGTPLILLHGWSLDRRMWRAQLPAFAADFLVVVVDRRGFGESTAPPGIAREADDICAILDRLGLARAVVVGMSQGGRVALHCAMVHADRVAGIVLQGAPLLAFHPAARGNDSIPIAHYAALVRSGRLDEMKELWRQHPLMRVGSATRQYVDELLAAYQGRDLLGREGPSPGPRADELATISSPTLVLTGEHDTAWRRLVADALSYGIPAARRATIRGGHLCNLDHPDEFNAAVATFAREVG